MDQTQGFIDFFEFVGRSRTKAFLLSLLDVGVVDVVIEPRLVDFFTFGFDFHFLASMRG